MKGRLIMLYLEFYDAKVTLTAEEEHAIYSDYSRVMRQLQLPREGPEFNQTSVVSHFLYFIDSFGHPSGPTADVLDRVKRKAVCV